MPFNSLGLHADLVRGVQALGFTEPTPIQKEAIPAGIEGRDVLACSATGSGKTAAFLLPMLHRFIGRERGSTRALVLSPTRELAAQIEAELKELAKFTKVSSAAVYGGVGMGPQRYALQRGVDVIIATPGRLLDHMRQNNANFSNLETLVLDEADRMLDMGFLPDIRRILEELPKKKQTLFFSATLPPEIARLTRELLHQPTTINIQRQAKPAAGITQTLYPVPHLLKSSLLVKIVQTQEIKNALVFVRTKRRADRVAEYLKRNGVSATRIHGDRTQSQRAQALEGFKRNKFQILVATDIAARGIDVELLSHVINFDIPATPEDYIHRVGRTARAQAKGDALTFVSPDQEGDLKAIERALKTTLPRVKLDDFDYNARVTVESSGGGDYGNSGGGGYRDRENRGGRDNRSSRGNGRFDRGPRERFGRPQGSNNERREPSGSPREANGNSIEGGETNVSRSPYGGGNGGQNRRNKNPRPWEKSEWKPRTAGQGGGQRFGERRARTGQR